MIQIIMVGAALMGICTLEEADAVSARLINEPLRKPSENYQKILDTLAEVRNDTVLKEIIQEQESKEEFR